MEKGGLLSEYYHLSIAYADFPSDLMRIDSRWSRELHA
jgi:hypothetical protein